MDPIRKMASTSIDVSSGVWGILNPFRTISDEVRANYDKVLFHGKSLQDLPSDYALVQDPADPARKVRDRTSGGPRFVINATNVKTGSLWRFSKPYMADYRVGMVGDPKVPLALAVAASSAFPPFLSPCTMLLDDFVFKAGEPKEPVPPSLRAEAVLTDGGVYDNLGLEAIWKRYRTVLVSDGGRRMTDDLQPSSDWARHSRRLLDLLQHQTSNLRRRQVVEGFQQGVRRGAYWGIQTDISKLSAESKLLPANSPMVLETADTDTRLTALADEVQDRIINWGYAICDASMRGNAANLIPATPPAPQWPCPKNPLR
jgi:NTE family protein